MDLSRLIREEVPGEGRAVIETNTDVAGVVARHAEEADLAVLGLQRLNHPRKVFSKVALCVAGRASSEITMISRR